MHALSLHSRLAASRKPGLPAPMLTSSGCMHPSVLTLKLACQTRHTPSVEMYGRGCT